MKSGSGQRTFFGFGFGPIQAGLFAYEAFKSGNFDRIVISEISETIVNTIGTSGCYTVNIADFQGIRHETVCNIEIYNPNNPESRKILIEALSEATEIATALPSVETYTTDHWTDPSTLLAEALPIKEKSASRRIPIYAGENHNHAAEILKKSIQNKSRINVDDFYVPLNTVIGKMCGSVDDKNQIEEQGLKPLSPGLCKAMLVEEFNEILINRLPEGVERGITVFKEKDDLYPFEEAKLYGHNASHFFLGLRLKSQSVTFMDQAHEIRGALPDLWHALALESGMALIRKYDGKDDLFTFHGYEAYARNLMARMLNPHLRDRVDRVTRDLRRKLGWNDRLLGTIRLCIQEGIRPDSYLEAASIAIRILAETENLGVKEIMGRIFPQDIPKQDLDWMKNLKKRVESIHHLS